MSESAGGEMVRPVLAQSVSGGTRPTPMAAIRASPPPTGPDECCWRVRIRATLVPLDRRLTNTVCGPLRDPAYVARICRWRRDTCGAWDRWWQQQGIQARPTGSPWFAARVSTAWESPRRVRCCAFRSAQSPGDWGGGATPVEPLSRCCSPGLHEVLIVAILQPDLNCLRPCHLGIWQARRRRYATPIAAGHCSPLERLPHAVTPLRGCRTR